MSERIFSSIDEQLHARTGAHARDWLDRAERFFIHPEQRSYLLSRLKKSINQSVMSTILHESQFPNDNILNDFSVEQSREEHGLETVWYLTKREGYVFSGISVLPQGTSVDQIHIDESYYPHGAYGFDIASDLTYDLPDSAHLIATPTAVDRETYRVPLRGFIDGGVEITPLEAPQNPAIQDGELQLGGLVFADNQFSIAPYSELVATKNNASVRIEQALWIATRETYGQLLQDPVYHNFSRPMGLVGYFENANAGKQYFAASVRDSDGWGIQKFTAMLTDQAVSHGYQSWSVACVEFGNNYVGGVEPVNEKELRMVGPLALNDSLECMGHLLYRFYQFSWPRHLAV